MQPQTLPLALHHALTKKHRVQGLNDPRIVCKQMQTMCKQMQTMCKQMQMVRKWMRMVHMGMALTAWTLQVRMARAQAWTVQGVWVRGVPMQTEGGHGVQMQVQRA